MGRPFLFLFYVVFLFPLPISNRIKSFTTTNSNYNVFFLDDDNGLINSSVVTCAYSGPYWTSFLPQRNISGLAVSEHTINSDGVQLDILRGRLGKFFVLFMCLVKILEAPRITILWQKPKLRKQSRKFVTLFRHFGRKKYMETIPHWNHSTTQALYFNVGAVTK